MWVKDKRFFVIIFCLVYLVRLHYLYTHSEDFVDYRGFFQLAILWLVPSLMVLFPYPFTLLLMALPRATEASDVKTSENSQAAIITLGCVGLILLVWLFESAF